MEAYPAAARGPVDQEVDSASDLGQRSLADAGHVEVEEQVGLRRPVPVCMGYGAVAERRTVMAEFGYELGSQVEANCFWEIPPLTTGMDCADVKPNVMECLSFAGRVPYMLWNVTTL